jgi:hypothetical protein
MEEGEDQILTALSEEKTRIQSDIEKAVVREDFATAAKLQHALIAVEEDERVVLLDRLQDVDGAPPQHQTQQQLRRQSMVERRREQRMKELAAENEKLVADAVRAKIKMMSPEELAVLSGKTRRPDQIAHMELMDHCSCDEEDEDDDEDDDGDNEDADEEGEVGMQTEEGMVVGAEAQREACGEEGNQAAQHSGNTNVGQDEQTDSGLQDPTWKP